MNEMEKDLSCSDLGEGEYEGENWSERLGTKQTV